MVPASRQLTVWANNQEVRETWRTIERLRRSGRPTAEAEEALAETYEAAVDDAIRTVMTAGLEPIVWPLINRLTGRRQKTALNLVGDTPKARRNELRDFFCNIVNTPPLVLPEEMPLPAAVPLPQQEDFCKRPVTSNDIMLFARNTPGGRTPGPDEVPIEALRVARVATDVARVMNSVLEGGAAASKWTHANIVGIPKKPGTIRKEEHRGIR